MQSIHIFGGLATAMAFVSYVFYMRSILKGITKPHALSWLNWSILFLAGALIQGDMDKGASSWVFYMSAFNCFSITLAALISGEKNFTKSDWLTFLAALAIIPIWAFTQNPLTALAWLITIDLLSFYPTIRKTYHKPHSEDLIAYIVAGTRYMFVIFALENPLSQALIYPLFLLCLEWSFAAYLLWLRRPRQPAH